MSNPNDGTGGSSFQTTNWGRIEVARGADLIEARQALADLCSAYWYPIYAYIRRRGNDADRAQDLAQGFFLNLLERDFLGAISPDKGRFRAFLLASCRNYLIGQHDRDKAAKRGRDRIHFSIDPVDAERRYAHEPAHVETPERIFERRWAMTVLDRALERLKTEMAGYGKAALFEHLAPILSGAVDSVTYAAVGEALSMTEGAVKIAAHRFRARYREMIRAEVAGTLDLRQDVDAEIRELLAALQSP
jgi:RNA polymerase sigma factor (sigma-70 family)